MAVTRWRPVDEYHPAVRLMVRYMWRQEPPLLPSGFADRMRLPRQLVSRWLQVPPPADGSDIAEAALPSLTPPLAVRLARAMGLAPREFLHAAGMCTDEEPLFTREDAWDYVVACVTTAMTDEAPGTAQDTETAGDGGAAGLERREDVRHALEAARVADLAHRTSTVSSAVSAAGPGPNN